MPRAIRIIHLEDSPRDAELVQERFRAEGIPCTIVWVAGKEPFESALVRDSFDLILCDYNLPDYDGMSAVAFARAKHPEAPLIVISGTLGDEEAVECLKQGATDYVLKDRLSRLAPAVRRALEEADERRQRRHAEAALRANEALYHATFDQAPVGITHATLAGRYLRANRQFCALLGYTEEELLTRGFSDLTHPEDLETELAAIARLRAGDLQVHQAEKRYRHRDGRVIWANLTVSLQRTAEGEPQHLITMMQDITEKKELEAQYLRAQRLESIGQLAAGVAHDLNNILTPILMSARLLRDKVAPEVVEKRLDTIERSARRGAEVVKQLLAFGRGEAAQRVPLQPRLLVEELGKLIKETFPKTVTFRSDLSADLWPVLGDPTQLHQVLLNLCVNARDAMPNGGALSVRASNIQLDEPSLRPYPGVKPGPFLRLEVADTGHGIPPEILDRIFDPFFTTKGPGKGTGLGLSTTLGIVRNHSGFLTIRSEVGKGSVFAVHLPALPDGPLTVPPPAIPPAHPGGGASDRGGGRRILRHPSAA